MGVIGEIFKVYFVFCNNVMFFFNVWLKVFDIIFIKIYFMNVYILEVVDNYSFEKDVVFMLEVGSNVIFFYFINLLISLFDCY